jgi:large subunit ribosomal protein L9
MDVKGRLEAEPLAISMPAGEKGRLFGSVTSATIHDALSAQGIAVERKRIDIPEKTIKSVGTTRVRVRLYGDEEAELRVVVSAAGESKETDGGDTASSEAEADSSTEAAVVGEASDQAESLDAADAPATAEDAADVTDYSATDTTEETPAAEPEEASTDELAEQADETPADEAADSDKKNPADGE